MNVVERPEPPQRLDDVGRWGGGTGLGQSGRGRGHDGSRDHAVVGLPADRRGLLCGGGGEWMRLPGLASHRFVAGADQRHLELAQVGGDTAQRLGALEAVGHLPQVFTQA